GDFHLAARHAITNGFPGFHHRQHVAFDQAITIALVQGHHVEHPNLRHTAWHIDNHAVDLVLWRAGHKIRIDRPFLATEQSVAEANLLGRALQGQRGDITFSGNDFTGADIVGVDPKELFTLWVYVDLTLTEDAIDRL